MEPTLESSVDACKDRCGGCWGLTYYAGLHTEFRARCYLYTAAAECGTLEGYTDRGGDLWSVPVGKFSRTEQQYSVLSKVVWPGNTLEVPADYFSGEL